MLQASQDCGEQENILNSQEAQAILADEISLSSQQLELHITEAYTAGQFGTKTSLSQYKRTGHPIEHDKYIEAERPKERSQRGAYKNQWSAEKVVLLIDLNKKNPCGEKRQ